MKIVYDLHEYNDIYITGSKKLSNTIFFKTKFSFIGIFITISYFYRLKAKLKLQVFMKYNENPRIYKFLIILKN